MARCHSGICFAALVAVVAVSASAAAPTFAGPYRLGQVGLVDVSEEAQRVVARLRAPLKCSDLRKGLKVMDGTMEGTVFVGTVTLCLEGPGCVTSTIPFLGQWGDGRVVGVVHLPSGCSSPGLEEGALRLEAVAGAIRGEGASKQIGSAAQVAAEKGDHRTMEEGLAQGMRWLTERNYPEAAALFRGILAQEPENVVALYSLGVAQANLKQPQPALDNLKRAAALAQRRELDARLQGEIHYNLACVHVHLGQSEAAVGALTKAVDLAGGVGFSADELVNDAELAPLREDEGFRALMARLRLSQKAKSKKSK